MANKLDPHNIVSVEEVPLANAVEQEALVNLLVKKGIIKKSEVYDEIKRVKKDLKVNS
jgi:hypothetical protein